MDSMVIATPWDKKHAFYYNQKINCMRASGWMMYDGKKYTFDPASDFGTLDWAEVSGLTTTHGSGDPATVILTESRSASI